MNAVRILELDVRRPTWTKVADDLGGFIDEMIREIRSIPFYKTNDGYRYAGHLLKDPVTGKNCYTFLFGEEAIEEEDGELSVAIRDIYLSAIDKLNALVISEEDFETWTTFHKESPSIVSYHRILESIGEDILLSYLFGLPTKWQPEETPISNPQEIWDKQYPNDVTDMMIKEWDDSQRKNQPMNSRMVMRQSIRRNSELTQELLFLDKSATCTLKKTVVQRSGDVVLNHNNPFADVSIKEQHFVYGSVMGQFEALGLTTSHTVTKQAKDLQRSYFVLQPGFKIKKEKLDNMKQTQDVLFDDTISTEIVQQDNNIYVYID